MEQLQIHSRLYDYEALFIKDTGPVLQAFGEETVYVIDQNVYGLYKERFAQVDSRKIFFMEPVEQKKNMETVMQIIHFWKQAGVKKNWKVVCFGGGITQDVTTIAGNLYLRNIDWYFFPTTLLAMCDSCIGGKCGINLGQYKNQIGVFYPPKKIWIDCSFLNTLSHDDMINGWGELLKFSLTRDVSFYQQIKAEAGSLPECSMEEYIYKGLFIKKAIIEEDEFESDLRRVLNYGHTFGHALEAYTMNRIPHGKAVIWGIDVANYIAWKEELIEEALYIDIKSLIRQAFLKEEIVIEHPKELFGIIQTDKKVKGNELSFAMLDAPSHLIVYPIKIGRKLEETFFRYLEETHEYYSS